MSLARTNSPLGKLIIRNIGDVGGPRSDLVDAELDNLINWAKSATRCIHCDTSTTNSSGAGPDVLRTFSLDTPNRLTTNNDYIKVEYAGIFAANDNDKAITAKFGGTEYANRGLGKTDLDGIIGWTLRATIARISSTSVHVSCVLCANLLIADSAGVFTGTSGNGGIYFTSNLAITGLADLGANATTLTCESLATAASDVSARLSVIELRQQ